MIERIDYPPISDSGFRISDFTGAGLTEVLTGAGLCREAAEPKAELFVKAVRAVSADKSPGFQKSRGFGAFFVPGRIEVLGKHTDYAGGRSIVAAAERGFCLVVAPRDDGRIRLVDVTRGEDIEFPLSAEIVPEIGRWSNYPMTVARRIARNFPGVDRGAQIAFGSDLPGAAGMSSSSAMIVAMFLALAEVNELWTRMELRENVADLIDLAGYLATLENGQTFRGLEGDRGVGTFGGSEDHTAILCCRPNVLNEYSYCPVQFRRSIPMPAGYTFAVGTSGVVAEKTGEAMEKYNRASQLASAAGELWRRETGRDDPHLAAALASSPDAADRFRQIIAKNKEKVERQKEKVGRQEEEETKSEDFFLFPFSFFLGQRFEHFRIENGEVLPAAGDALARGDVEAWGRCVDRSQRAAEDLLGNQIPETAFLAASARENGAAAASAFGAGFGGSVWAMVRTEQVDSFLANWAAAYRSRFPQHADKSQFFTTGAGPAAFQFGGIA